MKSLCSSQSCMGVHRGSCISMDVVTRIWTIHAVTPSVIRQGSPKLPASPGAIAAEARASTKRSGCQAGKSNMVSQARSRPMALRQSMKCKNNTWWPSGTWRTHHMLTHPGNQVPSHAHPRGTRELWGSTQVGKMAHLLAPRSLSNATRAPRFCE